MKQISSHDLHFSRPASGGGENAILVGLDVSFSAGEVSLVSGATGAGKSTLLYIFGGLVRPTSGEVRADGAPVSRWVAAHRDLWRRKTGFVFQNACLVRGITPLENVMLPLIPRAMELSEIRKAGISALESLEAVDLAAKRTGTLSGGERQKVAIARALSGNPEILFADEPTAHQDDASTARILKVFKACSGKGCIVIVASHDRRVRESGLIDRKYALDHGGIDTTGCCPTPS